MIPYAPWLCWLFPILGSLTIPLIARIDERARDFMAVLYSFLALLMCLSMIPDLLTHRAFEEEIVTWIALPSPFKPLEIGVLIDPLSIFMANIVAFISFLIMVYSLGYMHGDPGLTRYWFFMDFFIGSMLLLVLSNNFIQMLFGWEGVGLCSYALIGYYYRDEREYWIGGPESKSPLVPPSHCGMKAFVMTAAADTGLLIGIFILFIHAGTFNFLELYRTAPTWLGGMSHGLALLMIIMLLCGPIGKSAQFPLHEWLPEAMAGPASVSALIHAATMVKAGVYLVARLSPIFHYALWVGGVDAALYFFLIVAWIGGFTAFLAASQACVSLELKKALAYSTISQIGYMMMALGVAGLTPEAFASGYVAGLFHLMSHALFKSSLFLCSGAVIHACETIYMDRMGGLRRDMPYTYLFMLMGALSLSGIPPFIGFWSKDLILEICLETGQLPLLALGSVTAALTIFYSIRFIALTFHGERREHHGEAHIHEAPPIMWVPYGVLASLTLILGVAGPLLKKTIIEVFYPYLHEFYGIHIAEAHTPLSNTLMALALSLSMLILGGGPAYMIYIRRRPEPSRLVEEHGFLSAIHSFLWNRWYINSIYYGVFVDGFLRVVGAINRILDVNFIDVFHKAVRDAFVWICSALMRFVEVDVIYQINPAVAEGAIALYDRVKRMQTGVLSYNILYIMVTLFVLLLIIIFMGGV